MCVLCQVVHFFHVASSMAEVHIFSKKNILGARKLYEAGSILMTWKYYTPQYKIQLCG
jgi:hypothetical protein